MIFLDFETRSKVDIKKCGADVYASHPSTDILCMASAFDDDDVELWTPRSHPPYDLLWAIADGEGIVAHNAQFEFLIWNHVGVKKYGWPKIPISQFVCTMAQSYAMALPGSLENAAAALGIKDGKDVVGHRVMLQLSQPRDELPNGEVTWWEDEAKFKRLYEYCIQDVKVEREAYKRLVSLSDRERHVWLLDHEINQRGVQIDIDSVRVAIKIVEEEKIRLDTEMRKITDNQVATCSAVAQLKAWLVSKGLKFEGLAKADVADLLAQSIPMECRIALILRQEAAKTSTAKLEAMVNGVGTDGRIRGLHQYHGAGTGRWAGRRIQIQNLPRPSMSQKDINNVFGILERAS